MIEVLIIDDEKSIRVTLREFLIKEGISADIAENAEFAYQLMENKVYDIIITDIIMPHISGIDLLEKIREKTKDVYIIVMTGEPTIDTAVKALQYGANDYLTKPINKASLLKTVNQAIHIKLLQDQKHLFEQQNELYRESLEEMVKKRTSAFQKAMQSIVFLLSAVVGARDPYTASHQRRVGNLAVAIAEKMKLSDDVINLLRLTGYIHDIGKIVIPAEILSKPGKLSNLEMQIIKEHPLIGYEMLKNVDLPGDIAETEFQHHERYDGSGYPNGLKYNEISDEAHIIIVSDVVEAMMSHRPYRPSLGIDAALDEIRMNAGTLYKQEVVDACISLFNDKDFVIDDVEREVFFPI